MSSYKKYDSYKNALVTALEEIPSHWDEQLLNYLFRQNKVKNEGNLETHILSLSYGRIISKKGKANFGLLPESFESYQILKPGYIVFRFTDLQNDHKSLRVGYVDKNGIITSAYVGMKSRLSNVHSKYYYYLFHSLDIKKYFYGFGGGVRQSMDYNTLRKIKFPFPPLEEQTAIANFLDEKTSLIDESIKNKQTLIALLKEQKRAIINKAVTKGLNPDVPMKDSGIEWLGDVPEHWEVKKLRYFGKCQNGVSQGEEYFGSGFPFVSYGDVYKNDELPKEVKGLAKSTKNDKEKFSVKKGDVFFTRTSETIEEIGISSTCLETIENAVFAGFLIRFRPNTKKIEPSFSKFYFRCFIPRIFFVKEMNLVTRASLSQDLLKKLPVLIPPVEEQNKISNVLEVQTKNINEMIFQVQSEISSIQEYKQSLISEAVTGKIDVRAEVAV